MSENSATTVPFAVLLMLTTGFLDSYTYVARGGVFANAQTANVIFLGVNASEGEFHAAVSHLWPILAFILGVSIASYLASERAQGVIKFPIRLAIVVQIVVLIAVGFVPLSVPHWLVTVPVSFVAAIQMGLFRSVAGLNYVTIATTGNLLRLTQNAYQVVVEKDEASRRATGIYVALVLSFAAGAVVGAFASKAFDAPAVWIAAGLLVCTLGVLFREQQRGAA